MALLSFLFARINVIIFQEPSNDDYMDNGLAKSLRHNSEGGQSMNISTNCMESAAPSSSNLTLIKVSCIAFWIAARLTPFL